MVAIIEYLHESDYRIAEPARATTRGRPYNIYVHSVKKSLAHPAVPVYNSYNDYVPIFE